MFFFLQKQSFCHIIWSLIPHNKIFLTDGITNINDIIGKILKYNYQRQQYYCCCKIARVIVAETRLIWVWFDRELKFYCLYYSFFTLPTHKKRKVGDFIWLNKISTTTVFSLESSKEYLMKYPFLKLSFPCIQAPDLANWYGVHHVHGQPDHHSMD